MPPLINLPSYQINNALLDFAPLKVYQGNVQYWSWFGRSAPTTTDATAGHADRAAVSPPANLSAAATA